MIASKVIHIIKLA